MNKQLLVVGFHRSGTSMLAQEFYNSGLFLGDKLLEPHISNADGHFEDKEVFTLHEKILNLNNSNWMYSFPKNLITPLWLKDYMQNFINKRNQKHNIWGFKDPRTALFLNEWHNKLSNPYIVVIYRHYNETTQSLLYRDARAIAYNQNSNIDLFKDIELAYKMWLSYNKAILEYIEKNPKNSIVVSHQEVIKGFPIVQTTMDKFNLDLQKPKSSIKKELISPKSFSLPEISKDLKNELEEVWERLQKLSIAPASFSDIKKDDKNISLGNFKQHLEVLNIETVENRGIDKVIDFLNDLEKSIEEKIEQINKNIPLFINFQKTNLLIDSIEKLITKYPKNITLNTMIMNRYKNEKNFDKAKEYALKIFDISDKIYPYFYMNLALINFEEKNFTEAFFNINKAIELNPNNFWFYHTLSLIEFNTGKTEKSLENINKAIDLLKNDKNMNMNILFNFYKTKIMFLTFYNKNIKETFDNLEKDLPKEKIEDLKKQFIYKNKEVPKEDKKDIVQSLQKNNLYYEKITSLYENLDIKAQSLFLEFIVYYLNQLNTEDLKKQFIYKNKELPKEVFDKNIIFAREKKLTIIVNFYNMQREAKRTLYTLTEEYQNFSSKFYDVIAIDNNSTKPLSQSFVESFGNNFFYIYFNSKYPSPVEAINYCAKNTKSEYIMVMIDGARMLSPNILNYSFKAFELVENPFVFTIGMHIGEKLQNLLVEEGYNQEEEDKIISKVDWKNNGYSLFSISCLAASSRGGFFGKIVESNCFSLKRSDFLDVGGYNEKFISSGGGIVNLDFFKQITLKKNIVSIKLLGEASFHQFHGGVATNVPKKEHPINEMKKEYKNIYSKEYTFTDLINEYMYYGKLNFKYHNKFLLNK